MALSGRDFVGVAQTGSGKTLGVWYILSVELMKCLTQHSLFLLFSTLFLPSSILSTSPSSSEEMDQL